MPSTIPDLDEAIFAFRAATQRPAYRARILEGVDFEGGIASLRVLRSVERLTIEGGSPSIRQVAAELGVEHSTASRSVDGLVRQGLLARTRCADDQRQARLSLTEQGVTTLGAATARRQDVLAALVTDWSREDLAILTGLLERLRERFDGEFAL